MFIVVHTCQNCGVTNVFTSNAKEDSTAMCPNCGQKLTLQFSKSDLNFNGYWRGLCPKCNRHIATYVVTKNNIDFGFCGECRELFQISEGTTFERKDAKGKDVTKPEDKERQSKWMVMSWLGS